MSPACTGAAYHARFLRELVAQDIFRSQQHKVWEDGQPRCKSHRTRYVIDGMTHEIIFLPPPTASRRESTLSTTSHASQPPGVDPPQPLDDVQNSNLHNPFSYPISPTQSSVPVSSQEPMQVDSVRSASVQNSSAQPYGSNTYAPSPPAPQPPQAHQPTQPDDLRYWNNMFRDLGFGEAVDQTYPAHSLSGGVPAPSHQPPIPSHQQSYSNGRGAGNHQQPYAYHHMHYNAPGYGL